MYPNTKKGLHVLVIILTLLVFMPVAGAGEDIPPGREEAYRTGASQQPSSNNEELEILIILNDQVNTETVALMARQAQALSGDLNADPETIKIAVRSAVVTSLHQQAASSQATLLKFLENEKINGRVSSIKSYYIINLVYVRLSPELIETIASFPEVGSIEPNRKVELIRPRPGPVYPQTSSIGWNINHVKAPQVWNELGINGAGVVVGIVDTGVDWQHEALKTKYRGYNPANPNRPVHAYNWFDPYYYDEGDFPDDWDGHGTHVTGTLVGAGPSGRNQIGVAPGSRWIAARGLDDDGYGTDADLLAALQWMLAPTPNHDGTGTPNPAMAPDIVNNSWGDDAVCRPFYKRVIQNLRNAEILPVFAAGNEGPAAGTICLPGNYLESFTVGAINSNNALASFSSTGPGACGSFTKPNVSAPGVSIRSALSWAPDRNRGYEGGADWSGTSMAAPHVSGVAALLRSAKPSLTVAQLEQVISSTAVKLTNTRFPQSPNHGFGHGLIDAYAAVSSVINEVVPSPPVLISPANMAVVSGNTVNFKWNPSQGATKYSIRVIRAEDNTTLLNRNIGNNTSFSHGGFSGVGEQYRWQVRAGNSAGWSAFSTARLFTNGVEPTAPPPAPNPLLPAHRSNVAGTSVTFSWNAAPRAEQYRLRIVKVTSSGNELFYNRLVGSRTTISIPGFTGDGSRYRWHVRAGNSSGWSAFSTIRVFSNGL